MIRKAILITEDPSRPFHDSFQLPAWKNIDKKSFTPSAITMLSNLKYILHFNLLLLVVFLQSSFLYICFKCVLNVNHVYWWAWSWVTFIVNWFPITPVWLDLHVPPLYFGINTANPSPSHLFLSWPVCLQCSTVIHSSASRCQCKFVLTTWQHWWRPLLRSLSDMFNLFLLVRSYCFLLRKQRSSTCVQKREQINFCSSWTDVKVCAEKSWKGRCTNFA